MFVAGAERIARPPVQPGVKDNRETAMRIGISVGGLILLLIILWLLFGR